MFDPQDRRSALLKIFAGAGAATAVLAGARGDASAGPDAVKKGKKKDKPSETWEGRLVNPVYTPVGEGDTIDYVITALGGGGGVMDEKRKNRDVPMGDEQLFAYMQAKSGGDYTGMQSLTLQGINWRLMGADYASADNTWRLQVQVCDSNPDARPTALGTAAGDVDAAVGEIVTGCKCTCLSKCYQCGAGSSYEKHCGLTYRVACASD